MQRPAAASHNPTSIACCLLTVLIHACSSESTAPELYVPSGGTAVAAGQWHTCGLTTDGAAYCWGRGASGQLGNGSTTDSPNPVAVSGGLTFSALTTGNDHTCGLTTSRAAYCWGRMSPLYPLDEVPVAIPGGLSFIALASGNAHACAVTTSGAAYCWGFGGDGQFGNGSTTDSADSPIPVAVSGGLSFTALAGGDGHTCGLTTSGAAYCWGSNSFGQLGDGQLHSGRRLRGPQLHHPRLRLQSHLRAYQLRDCLLLGRDPGRRPWRVDIQGDRYWRGSYLWPHQLRSGLLLGLEQLRSARHRLDHRELDAGRGLRGFDLQRAGCGYAAHLRTRQVWSGLLLGLQRLRPARQRLDQPHRWLKSSQGPSRRCPVAVALQPPRPDMVPPNLGMKVPCSPGAYRR